MVTALTYQFQGWLAALMVNKRRRRTVIVVATMIFVLLSQIPNLLNIRQLAQKPQGEGAYFHEEKKRLQHSRDKGEITPEQYKQLLEETKHKDARREREIDKSTMQLVEPAFRLVNTIVPPGWLPLAAMDLAQGSIWSALIGTLGFTLIGSASLWRAYQTTVRLYQGQFTSGKKRAVAVAPPVTSGTAPPLLLERQLPWLSEHASAIALAGFRSLTRAPEAKMMLLSPIILAIVFGSMLLAQPVKPPDNLRPLMAFGAMATVLLGMGQIVGNQFGFDRAGFRVYVLCAARRKDILLGKNLAFAPLALGLSAVVALLLQVILPIRLDLFLAVPFQFVSMYLLFSLLGNCLSILAPMPIASGSMKPANPRGIAILFHLIFVFLVPLTLLPTLLPLGVQLLLEHLELLDGWPICLALSLVECIVVVLLYYVVLSWQGRWLQARELKILEIVTSKAE
jgi:hypothetical protein